VGLVVEISQQLLRGHRETQVPALQQSQPALKTGTQVPLKQHSPLWQAATHVPLEQHPPVAAQSDISRHSPFTQQPLKLTQRAGVWHPPSLQHVQLGMLPIAIQVPIVGLPVSTSQQVFPGQNVTHVPALQQSQLPVLPVAMQVPKVELTESRSQHSPLGHVATHVPLEQHVPLGQVVTQAPLEQQLPPEQLLTPLDVQTPPWQVSPAVQEPALQLVPFGWVGLEHTPVDGLQVPA
jgi:hypothetical protein